VRANETQKIPNPKEEMAAVARRGRLLAVSRKLVLAAADDLDGVQDNTKSFDVSGATRVIIAQDNTGTAGTAGIDVLCVSKDDGVNWTPDPNVLAIDSDDSTGTVLVGGALNAAGVEPTTVATSLFKAGPYEGKTAIRIVRKTSDFGAGGVTWVTGAPSVFAIVIGGIPGAPAALA
jgi:hypothetical protein